MFTVRLERVGENGKAVSVKERCKFVFRFEISTPNNHGSYLNILMNQLSEKYGLHSHLARLWRPEEEEGDMTAKRRKGRE